MEIELLSPENSTRNNVSDGDNHTISIPAFMSGFVEHHNADSSNLAGPYRNTILKSWNSMET